MENLSNKNNRTVIEPEDMYRQIVEYSFETTVIHADHQILYINQSGADFLGGKKEDIIGTSVLNIFQSGSLDFIKDRIREASVENKIGELIELQILKLDGTPVDVELYCHPVVFGEKQAIQSILRDITTRKKAERELKAAKKEINEISAPIVPVTEKGAVMPLVGQMDEERVNQLLRSVPPKVQASELSFLIIDFSGIYQLNSSGINFLTQITTVIKLLGVNPVITGIRPELARKSVEAGIDLACMQTFSNVKQALSMLEF